jgi:hypothetical protein
MLVGAPHLAGGHVECGEQGRRAVPLLVVVLASQRPAIGQLQITLRPLQRLDRRLFIDTGDDRIMRRGQVQADNIGSLGHELRVLALALGFTALRSQEMPDLLFMNTYQSRSHLLEELRGLGYDGSYSSVWRHAQDWEADRGSAAAEAYIPLSFAPGEAY